MSPREAAHGPKAALYTLRRRKGNSGALHSESHVSVSSVSPDPEVLGSSL